MMCSQLINSCHFVCVLALIVLSLHCPSLLKDFYWKYSQILNCGLVCIIIEMKMTGSRTPNRGTLMNPFFKISVEYFKCPPSVDDQDVEWAWSSLEFSPHIVPLPFEDSNIFPHSRSSSSPVGGSALRRHTKHSQCDSVSAKGVGVSWTWQWLQEEVHGAVGAQQCSDYKVWSLGRRGGVRPASP